jgi:hypothetical protein
MKYVVFLAALMCSMAYSASQIFGCTPEGFCPKTAEDAKKLKAAQEAKAKAKVNQTSNQPPLAPNKPATPPNNSKPEPAAKPK